jgi:lysophospholipase L1-like esterase
MLRAKHLAAVLMSVALALGSGSPAAAHHSHRVLAWATAPTVGADFVLPEAHFDCPIGGSGLSDQTVRNVFSPTIAGRAPRVRVTNEYGTTPLTVGAASLAVAGPDGTLVRGTTRPLTFRGSRSVTIPAGGHLLSDPVRLAVRPYAPLAVSLYLPEPTGATTMHIGSNRTNYLSGAGNFAFDRGAGAFTDTISCWLWVDGLEVTPQGAVAGAVVAAFGDSITDGHGSTVDADRRWPDALARRLLRRPGPTLAVLNKGISGNQLLTTGSSGGAIFGVSGLDRLESDVLDENAVRAVIFLEGINDINFGGATAARLIAGYREVVARLHARGIPVIGGTMTPYKGSSVYTEQRDAIRRQVNQEILAGGIFDATVDFAAAVADPADPSALDPRYDYGDHLHLNDAGYAAMAQAIDICTLLALAGGSHKTRCAGPPHHDDRDWVALR